MKTSKKTLITCIMLSISITYVLANAYKQEYYNKIEYIISAYETRINNFVENIFIEIEMAEAIVANGYNVLTKNQIQKMIEPMKNMTAVMDIEFINKYSEYHDAIDEYKAKNSSEPILYGPLNYNNYENILICAKEISATDENYNGYIVVVLDVKEVYSILELSKLNDYKYQYKITNSVYGFDEKIIFQTDYYNEKYSRFQTTYTENSEITIGGHSDIQIKKVLNLIGTLLISLILSYILYKFIVKKENNILKIEEKIFEDHLTGVYNRRKIEELNNLKNYGVFYIDLNDFKIINDTYGHEVGDEILIIFSNRIKKIIRSVDYIIRIGGDEFIIIVMNCCDEKSAENFYNRVKYSLLECANIGDLQIKIKASIGYALYDDENTSIDACIKTADKNMYIDKENK